MATVITITNVKGGVGKSITALFMANIFAKQKKKVLLIDMDSQNSLTSFFVEDYAQVENQTIYEALLTKIDVEKVIKEVSDNLDFIPADITLSNLTLQMTENRDFRLYTLLKGLQKKYDYIVIDTPPSLHIETKLALVMSNYVIIPTLLEKWATRSIDIVLNYIKNKNIPMQDIIKTQLKKVFILPTMTEKNRKIQAIVLSDLEDKYKSMVLINGISRKTAVQKLSYIGKLVDLEKLDAYSEYEKVVKQIIK